MDKSDQNKDIMNEYYMYYETVNHQKLERHFRRKGILQSDAIQLRDLRFNIIQDIPRNSLAGLNKLHTILLNNNHIERIQNGAFNGLPQLRHLFLYKNDIERIDRQTFSSLTNLRQLRLDSNPIICDCDILWLSQFLQRRSGRIQASAICRQPQQLQGRHVSRLTPTDLNCVTGAPHFTTEPQTLNISYGNTAYFSCRAAGNPTPQISWLHNNVELNPDDDRISVLNDGTLTIQDTQMTDRGDYQCVARSVNGEIRTNKVQLTYINNPEQPQLTRTPQDVIVSSGDTATFTCIARGFPRPTITWQHNGVTLLPSSRVVIDPRGQLQIRNVDVSQQGTYVCRATNDAGFSIAEARLIVSEPPRISVSPEDQSVTEGQTAIFRCDFTGSGQINVTWVNGAQEELPTNRRHQILEEGRALRIVQTKRSDRGLYTCRGSNQAGVTEGTAELSVNIQLSNNVLNREFEVETYPGNDIILQCDPDDPNIPTRWIKDGVALRSGAKYSLQGGRLVIRTVGNSDFGRYECFPENTVGFARNVITLQNSGRQRNIQIDQGTYLGSQYVNSAVRQATNEVNQAINQTMRNLFDRSRQHTVQDLIAIFRYPSAEALELARAEEIFEQTLQIIHRHVRDGHEYNISDSVGSYKEILSPGHLELIANMSGCFPDPRVVRCSEMCFHKKFRSMDGICNNLQSPMWGASVIPLKRLQQPIYENGFNTPVGWERTRIYNNYHLPSPRLVSSFLMSTDHVTEDEKNTHMLMQWGQFVDHDMDLTPQSVSNARFSDGRYCNETCENQYPCFPITVPRSDTRIQNHACLGFSRSSAMCNTGSTSVFYKTFTKREQINAVTAFIDGSSIYGSSDFESQRLREFTNGRGLMREGVLTQGGKRLLPFDTGNFLHHFDCQLDPSKRHVPCFRAGDNRVNEQLALTAMHTLWMRQHNHIATELLGINPHWDGNMLFHETRKIIGALMQHITYTQWLPHILGPSGMQLLGEYKGYNPTVDPSISNEFATAAMRFGHSLVQPIIFRLNESLQPIPEGNLPLHKAFFSPYKILEEGGIDPLLRGLYGMSAKKRMPDEVMNSELTEKLFSLANVVGQDLASLNIQRGRDHGLPFYNQYRVLCNLTRAATFDDFRREMPDQAVRDKLLALYSHPDNVDLFVGGMAEQPLPGGKVGPTFLCILVDQFRRLRDGDRFWYENPDVFESTQLAEIKQITLSRVICDSSDGIEKVQKDTFIRAERPADYLLCKDIPKMNFKIWSDCCTDCGKTGDFQSLINHFRQSSRNQFSLREDRDHIIRSNSNTNTNIDPIRSNSIPMPSYINDQMQLFNQQMTSFDSKVGGMENTISKLTKTITKLKRKMRKMTKMMQRTMNPLVCIDNKGRKRKEKEVWKINSCRTCRCRNNQVECDVEKCQKLTCPNQITPRGQCCPVCSN
ncbi:hypothetical protein FSP39_008890 [Pinctada imbricata]|uniref:Peroxidase n=1 Tax=Pinctada imbricata TaxID=66713 RepID=A0AA88XPY1_PINIB|nr:hypothetical protein FSP39_008890 [Pinctada imbricata]